MAPVSIRSSQRSGGYSTRTTTRLTTNDPSSLGNSSVLQNPEKKRPQEPNIGRKKRKRDLNDDDDEQSVDPKKAKFIIEIDSAANSATTSKSRPVLAARKTAAAVKTVASPPPPPQTEKSQRRQTIHHEKVANGIKHELDRLQPSEKDTKDGKRKLRSQEGTKFKSDLSLYFPEYDEVIGNEPKEEHILDVDTPIILIDSAKNKQPTPKTSSTDYPLKTFFESLFDDLYDARRIDFSFLEETFHGNGEEDPLSESYFETKHRRPERQEKAIRNGDKGRAQHEKDQVMRLLDGLQGPDWLKVMGVSGITESRKKEFDPARKYFIKGCKAIIEKFRTWREEEKKRKVEKEKAEAEAVEAQEKAEVSGVSSGDPPEDSDVDVSAARQLHEEATARSARLSRSKKSQKRSKVERISSAQPKHDRDFKSFFEKPHLREAALNKRRHSERKVYAWGCPLPDIPERDFELPEEYRDEETLKIHARRKRRDRRVGKSETR